MNLLPLVLIVVGVVVLVAVGYVLRRRRMASAEEIPEIGTPIDYTSLPVNDEPTGWRDRFNHLSIAGKILLVIVPLLVIIGGVVIVLALGDGLRTPPQEALPPPIQYAFAETTAALANPRQIVIRSSSNLPPDTEVTAELLGNTEPFDWYNSDDASTRVANDGRIEFRLSRLSDAPAASQTVSYTVKLFAQVDSQTVENTVPLLVPPIYARDFYAQQAATGATAAPTVAATAAPTAAAEPTAEPTTEPTAEGPAPLRATVFNGGNVRSVPQLSGSQVLDQINANEQVQLLQKTPNGQWYLIQNLRTVVGWVNSTLLTVAPEVAEQVPVQGSADPLPTTSALGSGTPAPTSATPAANATPADASGLTARVFNGGNVRSVPQLSGSQVLDQINAGETVELLQKSANGQWYQIRNVRSITGWVNVTLLTIDASIAARVPVAR